MYAVPHVGHPARDRLVRGHVTIPSANQRRDPRSKLPRVNVADDPERTTDFNAAVAVTCTLPEN